MANTIEYTALWEPTDIGTAATTIYTSSPVSTSGVTKNISATITNTTSAGITVTVTAAGKTLVSSEIVPANSRLPLTISDLSNGKTITASASATGLVMHCNSGIVIN